MDTNTERRLRLRLDAARDLLEECMEFVADYVDTKDGSDGVPVPNAAMALHWYIEELVDGINAEFPRKAVQS
jgi:hypothetical protein